MGAILSVDDDCLFSELIGETLTDYPEELILVNHPVEAIEIANTTLIDVAILDISLPVMNGFELKKILSSIDPAMRTIFLSSEMNKANLLDAIRCQASDFLQKPFQPSDLKLSVLKRLNEARQLRIIRSAV